MDLFTENGRTFRRMTPAQFPTDDREYIIDYAFQWRAKTPHWSPLDTPEGGRCMRGEIEADTTEFGFLRVRVGAGEDERIAVRVELDGQLQEIIPPRPGTSEDSCEFMGRIEGQHLSAVEIHAFDKSGNHAVPRVPRWVMLVKEGAPTPFSKPAPTWPGLLAEADPELDQIVPRLGILFDADELRAVRERLHSGELADDWAKRLQGAEEFARTHPNPEMTAGPIIEQHTSRWGRTYAYNRRTAYQAGALAYAGLIEGRVDLLRLAARWALTWTRCRRWVCYGVECIDAIPFSHGRFIQAMISQVSARILDWCGCVLTEAGRRTIAQAIHDLGIRDIDCAFKSAGI